MNRRILIADDDESLRRVTQMELEELGYDVVTAADGPAPCACWRKRGRRWSSPT